MSQASPQLECYDFFRNSTTSIRLTLTPEVHVPLFNVYWDDRLPAQTKPNPNERVVLRAE